MGAEQGGWAKAAKQINIPRFKFLLSHPEGDRLVSSLRLCCTVRIVTVAAAVVAVTAKAFETIDIIMLNLCLIRVTVEQPEDIVCQTNRMRSLKVTYIPLGRPTNAIFGWA